MLPFLTERVRWDLSKIRSIGVASVASEALCRSASFKRDTSSSSSATRCLAPSSSAFQSNMPHLNYGIDVAYRGRFLCFGRPLDSAPGFSEHPSNLRFGFSSSDERRYVRQSLRASLD